MDESGDGGRPAGLRLRPQAPRPGQRPALGEALALAKRELDAHRGTGDARALRDAVAKAFPAGTASTASAARRRSDTPARGHARGLTFDQARWEGPRGPHDTEKRWDDARRLLHDATLPLPDRVAGLLLLLYAQSAAGIASLTTGQIRDDGTSVTIMLGTAPISLPEPLTGLVRELVATRSGHASFGLPGTVPWLFPGGRPGHPLNGRRLGDRLKNIGLHPRQARATALFTLASQLPAAILARMLGIHIQAAVQWQKAASGDWMAYAADLSRRPPGSLTETPP